MTAPTLFDLTPLTRDAEQQRRVVIQRVDVEVRRVKVMLWAAPFSLLIGGMTYPLLKVYALLPMVAVELAAIWLFIERSRKGMRLTNFQTQRARRRAQTGMFFVGGRQIHPLDQQIVVLHRSSMPARHVDPVDPAPPVQGRRRAASPTPDAWGDSDADQSAPATTSGWD
jgi:hypothetical protein